MYWSLLTPAINTVLKMRPPSSSVERMGLRWVALGTTGFMDLRSLNNFVTQRWYLTLDDMQDVSRLGTWKRLQNTFIVQSGLSSPSKSLAAWEVFRFKPANTSVSHRTVVVVVVAHGKWGIPFWTISINSMSRLIKKFTPCYTAHFTNRLTGFWNTLYRLSTKGLNTFEMRRKTNEASFNLTPASGDRDILFQITRIIVIMCSCR